MNRIKKHMILPVPERKTVSFSFDGKKLEASAGEMISSALIANGIHVFSHHHRDGSPQGIYCANGQCAQCTVVADGLAVKSCITPVKEGMEVRTLDGLPEASAPAGGMELGETPTLEPDVLIVGGGPAGLAAAIELGRLNASVILVDDKHRLGGKLVLQTHKFFGSVEDCHAGTRGIDIASKLEAELSEYPSVKVWLNSMAVAVFSDRRAGVVRDGKYYLVKPRALLVSAGAREKTLAFPGNTLPGVYGAGAFQTLVNRDLVAPSKRLFIVGGGNVGLIAGYHALQAGIEVAGLAEALPEVGGYKVHADKLVRLGVPLFKSHTVMHADGKGRVESVTIAECDRQFKPVPGTEKTFRVDTVLVAVGLNPCSELYSQARDFGMNVFAAGDAEEIAEASAAMFSGKIAGAKIAKSLGMSQEEPPREWREKLEVLKSRPGAVVEPGPVREDAALIPVFHCSQEIPCNPCVSVCPKKGIKMRGTAITSLPFFDGDCIGCGRCVAICPGLAVTLLDYRKDSNFPTITLAFEMGRDMVKAGEFVRLTDAAGRDLSNAEVVDVRESPASKTLLVSVKADRGIAPRVAGIKLREWEKPAPYADTPPGGASDDIVICRCERVTLGTIRKAIREGARDINALKAATRVCMGACQSKTCESQLAAIFRSEGVKPEEVTPNTQRPLVMEVFLGQFANAKDKAEPKTSLDSSSF